MLTTTMESKVYLIGIGTGNPLDLTPRAVEAISDAQVVIGHYFSIGLIENRLTGKQVISGSMSPLERSASAVDYAIKGFKVAVIAIGDPGIYAIASTFLSYLKENDLNIPLEIVPGITTASSAAARLGSPLGHDFAVVSLADQAGRWQDTLRRVKAVSRADFVLVIYNPLGKLGNSRLVEICNVLLSSRPPDTPVGLVGNAGQKDEDLRITILEKLPREKIAKDTLIITGNSKTYIYKGWMVTPRPYQPGLGY